MPPSSAQCCRMTMRSESKLNNNLTMPSDQPLTDTLCTWFQSCTQTWLRFLWKLNRLLQSFFAATSQPLKWTLVTLKTSQTTPTCGRDSQTMLATLSRDKFSKPSLVPWLPRSIWLTRFAVSPLKSKVLCKSTKTTQFGKIFWTYFSRSFHAIKTPKWMQHSKFSTVSFPTLWST